MGQQLSRAPFNTPFTPGDTVEIIPELMPVVMLFAPFFVTYLALHFILFRPLMDYLDEREAVSGRALAEATDFETATGDKLEELEAKLATARREIGELRKAARDAAGQDETEILDDARTSAAAVLAEAVVRIGKEKADAATQLRGTAKVLSADIAEQVLGRSAKGEA